MYRKYPVRMPTIGIDLMVPGNVYFSDEGYTDRAEHMAGTILEYHSSRRLKRYSAQMAQRDGGFVHFVDSMDDRFVHIFYRRQSNPLIDRMNRAKWETVAIMLLGEFQEVMRQYDPGINWDEHPIRIADMVSMSVIPADVTH